MDHGDHVRLIRSGVEGSGPVWADLGSGEGAFTLALADLLGAGGAGAVIHSVDRDASSLAVQARRIATSFPSVRLEQTVADFTHPLELPPLDGLVMANSLHFVEDKVPVLRRIVDLLRPGGRFVLVEYGSDRGNPWVPYPFSFQTWQRLAADAGLRETTLLATVPSRFLGSIYSARSSR